jgi:hypothetical protein
VYLVEVDFLRDRRPRTRKERPRLQWRTWFGPGRYAGLLPMLADPDLRQGAILVGIGLAGILGLGLSGLGLSLLQMQQQSALAKLRPSAGQARTWQEQTRRAEAETVALNRVFTLTASWNELLADLARRTPEKVQLLKVEEQRGSLIISGRASEYPEVVTFLQNLRQAPFLDPQARLVIDRAESVSEDYAVPGAPADTPPGKAFYVDFSLRGRLRNPAPTSPRN